MSEVQFERQTQLKTYQHKRIQTSYAYTTHTLIIFSLPTDLCSNLLTVHLGLFLNPLGHSLFPYRSLPFPQWGFFEAIVLVIEMKIFGKSFFLKILSFLLFHEHNEAISFSQMSQMCYQRDF